ncbi:MAG: periplasmic heavy metal sensor [Balneola sp.]|nr:MAG: periplasmic heavy metal sensor [Balneola sp.]
MKRVAQLFIIAVFAITSTQAFAQQRGEQRRALAQRAMQAQQQNDRLGLDLTDEQKEQMKAIKMETQKSILPIQNELREKQAQLRSLTTSENANFGKAEDVVRQIGDLRTELQLIQLSSREEIRNLLTEEQQLKFDTMQGRKNKMKRTQQGQQLRKGNR